MKKTGGGEKIDRFFQQVYGGILAFAVGDALGVPVEFSSREERMRSPVTGMRAYGTHQQPAGTWSDDTSMTLCALESLSQRGITHEEAPEDMMRRLCAGYPEGIAVEPGDHLHPAGLPAAGGQSGGGHGYGGGRGRWPGGHCVRRRGRSRSVAEGAVQTGGDPAIVRAVL